MSFRRWLFCGLTALAAIAGSPAHSRSVGDEAATEIAFGFAPPLGRTLRYEITESVARGDAARGVRFIRDYRFERDTNGYRLWVELQSAVSDDDGPAGRFLEAVAAPMIGVRYAIGLSADGEPRAIDDQARLWTHIAEGVAVIRADGEIREDLTPELRTAFLAMLDSYAAADETTRRDNLLIGTSDILAFAGRSLPPVAGYEIPVDIAGSDPVTLRGTIAASKSADDSVSISVVAEGIGHDDPVDESRFRIGERIQYRVAPSSGLLHEMRRERRFGTDGAAAGDSRVEITTIRLVDGWDRPESGESIAR